MYNAIPIALVALEYVAIIIEWQPATSEHSEIAGYRLFMQRDNEEEELITPNLVQWTSYVVWEYNPHVRYRFRVEAVDMEGNYTTQVAYFPS